MASNQNLKDLQWALQAINSASVNLHSISFYLTHPVSSCHQETENSISINISTDQESLQRFSQLLMAIGASNSKQTSLRNLEFQKITWDLQQLKCLHELLQKNLNIKQIVFRRNRFNTDGLLEISEMLKANGGLKEIIFSESQIGSSGAGLIASALKVNESLEELQIWEDSIGSRGAEELSKMIEVNSTLKLLIILDSQMITATPLISAVLARNRAMEVHVWTGENGEKSSKVVEFVPENSTLRIYRIDLLGSCRVACALGWNLTVRSLDMTGIRLKSKWAREFRDVLEQNRTLKEVKLSKSCLKDKAIIYVAAGLFKNQCLESLYVDGNWFSGIGVEHLLCPLSCFSNFQNQANTSLKTITFGGGRTKIGRDGVAAILQMLTTNQSLVNLGILDDLSLRQDDIIRLFKSLERNTTLKYLSLRGCKGVEGEVVLQTIMETLQVNPWIEDIDLSRTPLQKSGKTEEIYQKLGQNGRNEPEMDLLKGMALTVPKSCRVLLVGQEYAGKTTLCNSISQNFTSPKLPYLEQVKTLISPVEQAVRTEGVKIKTIKDENTKISIWDLAGQQEFYALHDLMFPGQGSASFFLIVSSFFRKPHNREQKNSREIEEDLLYWLRFIVSNSRRATGPQSVLPMVTIVLTHFDKITQPSENVHNTVREIQRLRQRFQAHVEFYPTVFTVDARSSGSVSKLSHHLRMISKTILERVPRVYEVCNDLINIISEWRSENYSKPAIKWKEFCELCQIKVPALRIRTRHDNQEKVEMRRRAIANCLHHIGEVIFFQDLGFLILDCEWFCGEVLGQLVKLQRRQSSMESNGFLSRKELEKILKGSLQSQIPGMGSKVFENLEASDLVRMMLKLELCYEQEPGEPNSLLLIPSLLQEGRGRSQRWQSSIQGSVYAGRHLECDDSSHTFLTPGFFPRLQVHLHNKIFGSRSHHGATYSLEKYLITTSMNGINIRVELGGQLGYYIDVLACSTNNLTETLRLFHQLIIPTIQSLCHGVTLRESILRPDCVKNLTPPRYRRTQHIPLHQLKQAILSVPADAMYDYQHTWASVLEDGKPILQAGFDYARDLLSDDDFREVLHRRYNDLYNLAVELAVPLEDNQDRPDHPLVTQEENSTVEPTFDGLAKGVEAVLRRLKIIEQEIRDLKQEIQGLRYYEHRLLTELHHKVNYMVNYTVQIEERKVPNMFYFVQTENYSRRLVTNMISGMTALRLHMLCEFRREMHVVEDQLGCELMQVDNIAVKCLVPYMKKFMKLLTFALKIGAHVAVGMGEMIPDLSREVVHLFDSSLVTGVGGAMAAGALGAAVLGNRSRSIDNSRNIQQDLRTAHQWLLDFLKDRRCSTGKEIAEKFGLWRVRYRDTGQIAWVCRRHIQTRANEIIELPV